MKAALLLSFAAALVLLLAACTVLVTNRTPAPAAPASSTSAPSALARALAVRPPLLPRAGRSAADRTLPVLDWAALAECESSSNPRALGAGGAFRGLYQFRLSTWHWVGGTGDPIDASATEQLLRARLLFTRAGTAPWPVCGRLLRVWP